MRWHNYLTHITPTTWLQGWLQVSFREDCCKAFDIRLHNTLIKKSAVYDINKPHVYYIKSWLTHLNKKLSVVNHLQMGVFQAGFFGELLKAWHFPAFSSLGSRCKSQCCYSAEMTKRFKVMNNEEHRATMQSSLHSSASKACLNGILLQEVVPGIRNSRRTLRALWLESRGSGKGFGAHDSSTWPNCIKLWQEVMDIPLGIVRKQVKYTCDPCW